ncbi:MAG: Do family serine endopeptidase, partial [Proteobacteria bacterium]|nr:Do family serine endopeptidase [Pseudomonadota bacterium]
MHKIAIGKIGALFALILLSAGAYAQQLPDFTQLVQKNAPAVVNIKATHTGSDDTQNGQIDPQDVPEIFRRFFGPQGPGGGHPRFDGTRVSMGSGFIISSDGYVLTNNHVVDGADQIVVRLSDRRELDAKVIGTDTDSDIALLKVNATGLPTVAIGDSSKLKPGQWVVAIGSPFGFDHSVTHGIVSYVGRGFGGADQQYVPFIQTDVPINRGNSGGPLFNMDGQVVGINSQIVSNTGSSVGISLAIPIDIAMNTVQQLKQYGHVSRGMIGVQIQNMDRAMAQSLGLPSAEGALVASVTPGSGADKAGVQVQDVILAFDGHAIDQSSDLPPLVGNTKPGSKAELKIFRNGKTIAVPVTVGELPQDKNEIAGTRGAQAKSANALGIVVDDLTAEQRKQLGIKDGEGVVITNVRGAAAQRSGLQPGDVVTMVGRKAIKSAADFNAAVKDVKPG